ncbi:MAG TPA: UPF0149 family protein [Xanthomonadaceae bacterium]|jgi:uncharacterized protein|nr:UPF0149 family protein [Xanthomonadaceae bacterium]
MYYEPIRAPIGDAELDALYALLDQRAVPFKGMSLEMLDGFLNALAVGPEPVPEEEWVPKVWGGRPPRWESREEEGRVRGQLIALWNDVVRRVAIEPEEQESVDKPLIATPDANEAEPDLANRVGVEWAYGFLDGIRLRGDAWDVWIHSEQWIDEALWCIQAIAMGEWPVPEGQTADPISAIERGALIAGLPQILHDLNAHRFEKLVSHEPIRKPPAPRRNDPCHCGSGKKYKKCCGAAGR